jgi:hypothetical protein
MGAVLHDVRLPGTTHTLDHLVVAPSGIWLIDTARITGRLTRRDVGTRQDPVFQLLLDGVNQTSLVDPRGILRQTHHTIAAMQLDVEVQTAMCLIDTTWPISARPFTVHNHWITWPRALTDKIRSSGLVTIRTAHDIAHAIAEQQTNAANVSIAVDDASLIASKTA